MFKSWLISNIGFLFAFFYLILSLALKNLVPVDFLTDQESGESMPRFLALLLPAIATYLISASCADAGFGGSLIVGLIGIAIVILGLLLTWGGLSGRDGMATYVAAYGAGISVYFIIAIVVSIFVAIYAYKNFEDVVDTRWLYRNSEVSIYAEGWKYALNRFAVTLGGFAGIAFSAIIVVMLATH